MQLVGTVVCVCLPVYVHVFVRVGHNHSGTTLKQTGSHHPLKNNLNV